jgi:hypothetical protein
MAKVPPGAIRYLCNAPCVVDGGINLSNSLLFYSCSTAEISASGPGEHFPEMLLSTVTTHLWLSSGRRLKLILLCLTMRVTILKKAPSNTAHFYWPPAELPTMAAAMDTDFLEDTRNRRQERL